MSILEFFSMLGGVGLFLYGMTIMSSGLQNAAGDKIRVILEHVTSNKLIGVFLGIGVTVLVQSSSATDMMVIGFVNSGLMTLAQAILVIMGANIGTTITAQITAFDLASFAPILLFIGCIMYLFIKKPYVKHIGSIILGFGMLFVGISLIKDAIRPLAQSQPFINFLSRLSNPALAVLFGLAFTALLQSSSSSTVIFQAFAIQGLLEYHTAVYLIIGAAIGSVFPNILASLTTNRNGKRTALLNLTFNLFRAGILCFLLALFPGILDLIQQLSPNDIGRQIANTHTLFAIFAVLVMLPFSAQIARLTEKLIPILPEETRMLEGKKLQYMVSPKNTLPSVVIRQAMLEITRLGQMARDNLETAVECFFSPTDELMSQVEDTESIVDYLTNEISDRLIELRNQDISESDIFRATKLTLICSNFERISDHAENIIEYKQKITTAKEDFSKPARKELQHLAEAAIKTIDASIEIFSTENFDKLPECEALEEEVDELQRQMNEKHINRLMKGKCDPAAGVIFTDMSTDLERCSDHAINIATALKTTK
ncbi:MAG: Na/Pi cotransporter family protein [Lachnospiraceae bacterium]|nr:Na/Pi cotransporter family protein [Lachnospiraceae bacterium]MBQ1608780.1 Na/Pi cotransporter family protein [Lachnospiraceae bacterium]MBQ2316599.1 Na/Pi cotransporter family protein [Lachnospiraceae bacterium]MBQ2467636.1 Na/Pi cotransporter family protein [Lachnospiraceae bacterium]MBQ4372956.1 Na/Pi cotransporter family protein [Lachnospiraceae bacterium]